MEAEPTEPPNMPPAKAANPIAAGFANTAIPPAMNEKAPVAEAALATAAADAAACALASPPPVIKVPKYAAQLDRVVGSAAAEIAVIPPPMLAEPKRQAYNHGPAMHKPTKATTPKTAHKTILPIFFQLIDFFAPLVFLHEKGQLSKS
jgi:hypothetical protein